ncbi:hypothetical protein E0485_17620 [Paenibacillus albiflavus]|uniref:Uncharacterized protein n=1 Tax=Paenibacillus albiflavus TaxID=2545760 RepID=A0A4R4E799_9BACL|nr:ankyrin repeat domain-containing protein [Paenibacillus albiflavus]TCZ75419.1 hypothetical protein E0485_17620 [Paenibacillus albiflavus]
MKLKRIAAIALFVPLLMLSNTQLILADSLTTTANFDGKKMIFKQESITSQEELLRNAIVTNQAVKVKELLAQGVNPNYSDKNKNSLMEWAITRPELMKLLLNAGANPNTITPSGDSILELAVKFAEPQIVELLIEAKADIAKGTKGYNGFKFALSKYLSDATSMEMRARYSAILDSFIGKLAKQDKITYSNGDVYTGGVIDGVAYGQGKLKMEDGSLAEGRFIQDLLNGQVSYTSKDGDKYKGEAWQDYWEGQGTYTFPDGEVHKGEYWNGVLNGYGSIIYTDGGKYVGEFIDHEQYGYGKYIDVDGKSYSGEIVDGRLNGKGVYTEPSGYQLQGVYEDDQITGWARKVSSDGVVSYINLDHPLSSLVENKKYTNFPLFFNNQYFPKGTNYYAKRGDQKPAGVLDVQSLKVQQEQDGWYRAMTSKGDVWIPISSSLIGRTVWVNQTAQAEWDNYSILGASFPFSNLEEVVIQDMYLTDEDARLFIKKKDGQIVSVFGDDLQAFDKLFYTQNPQEKFKWTAEIWDAIKQGRVLRGMNQEQVTMAWGKPNVVSKLDSSANSPVIWEYKDHKAIGTISSLYFDQDQKLQMDVHQLNFQ